MGAGTGRNRKAAVGIVAASFFAMLMSANLATPLYAGYSERFDFSPAVLALIFATYAIVLVPSLLIFGQVSDRFGRRPVIAVGLLVAMAGLGCFAVADALPWLFAARALLGLLILAGFGHGLAILAAQDDLTRIAPEEQRAEISAAFYVCVYAGVAGPVIGVGILAAAISLYTAASVLAAVTGTVALVVAAWHLRHREPQRYPPFRAPSDS